MAKFRYYGLALSGTDLFLPEPLRGRDFAKVQPSSLTFPRIFKMEKVAELAKRVWERENLGKTLEVVPMKLEQEK